MQPQVRDRKNNRRVFRLRDVRSFTNSRSACVTKSDSSSIRSVSRSALHGATVFPSMNRCFQSVILVPLLVAFSSTAQVKDSRQAASPPGKFVDVTSSLGVRFEHAAPHTSKKYLLETMGSGVALCDYDNDGRLDLFVVNGAEISDPMPPGTVPQKTGPKYWNRLYHQKSDGTF